MPHGMHALNAQHRMFCTGWMLCIGCTSLDAQHRMFFTWMFYIGCTALDTMIMTML